MTADLQYANAISQAPTGKSGINRIPPGIRKTTNANTKCHRIAVATKPEAVGSGRTNGDTYGNTIVSRNTNVTISSCRMD